MKSRHRFITGFAGLAIAAGGVAAAQPAEASSVNLNSIIADWLNTQEPQNVKFEDQDRSYPIEMEPATGTLDVGDVVRGFVRIDDLRGDGVTSVNSPGIVAVFSGMVYAKNVGNPEPGVDESMDVEWYLGPDPAFGTYFGDQGHGTRSGAMLALYDLADHDEASETLDWDGMNFEDAMAHTTANARLWGTFGFDAGFGELDLEADPVNSYFGANGEHYLIYNGFTDDIQEAQAFDDKFADIYFGLNYLDGFGDPADTWDFLMQEWGQGRRSVLGQGPGENHMLGLGSLSGQDKENSWPITSDADFTILVIPTPTAALAGLVGIGFVGLTRRRRDEVPAAA